MDSVAVAVFPPSGRPISPSRVAYQLASASLALVLAPEARRQQLLDDAIPYRLLIEHIPAITYIAAFDDSSSTIYTSPQIETMLGFSQAEWMADSTLWVRQIHPDDRALVLAELDRIHSGGAPVPSEYRMLTRDGCVVWFRDEAAVLRDNEGRPIGLYGVMLDITEQKDAQVELARMHEQLVHARDVERLRLARELHDEAIQQLLGASLLLEESQRQLECTSCDGKRAVIQAVTIERTRGALRAVVAQLRALVGELRPVCLDDIGLPAALESLVAQLQAEHGSDLPEIALTVDPNTRLLPTTITLCLHRAAQEGVRNALRHARAERVSVEVALQDHSVTLTVTDDGCGMTAAPDTRALLAAGHFGLAGLAERVVEVGGRLLIETQPGYGTTIRIWVPWRKEE